MYTKAKCKMPTYRIPKAECTPASPQTIRIAREQIEILFTSKKWKKEGKDNEMGTIKRKERKKQRKGNKTNSGQEE